MYAPHRRKKSAIINIQIAKMIPNILIPPCALLDEKSTKYPIITNIVAGNKLKNKHIIHPFTF
jgi:hypothetical protein